MSPYNTPMYRYLSLSFSISVKDAHLAEAEARMFPGSSFPALPAPRCYNSEGAEGEDKGDEAGVNGIPPELHTMPHQMQHAVLLRELLLVLSGVEGQYIRVAVEGGGGRGTI